MKQEIIDDLQLMFEEAEDKGMWFFCAYQQLWFTPTELRQYQSEGHFRWGVQNWQLRDPSERKSQLVAKIAVANDELGAFRVRMK